MNFNRDLIESIKNNFSRIISEEMGVGVAGERGSSFQQRQQQAFQQRQAERRAANAAKRTPEALAAKKAEREAKIAETRARAPKHTEITTPKGPTIKTVEPGYKGPSINADGSFNLTAEQQRVAAENRAAMATARDESATTRMGRMAQRIGSLAFRPARSQYEAEQQAGARADLERAYDEAQSQGRRLGYEDQATLYGGFQRRGYQQPMFGGAPSDAEYAAQQRYNKAKEERDRVVKEIEDKNRERQSAERRVPYRDPNTGQTRMMTSAELDAEFERTRR